MKKKLLGTVLVALLIPLAAHASSFVGKVIEGTFPLYIDGQRVAQDVIVVEGTSFIPVRAASELFGYDVTFDETTRTVLLNKQQAEEMQIQTIEPQMEIQSLGDDGMDKENIQYMIDGLEIQLVSIEQSIIAYQYQIQKLEEKESLSPDEQQWMQEYRDRLDEIRPKLQELQQQKADLEEQLKQFE